MNLLLPFESPVNLGRTNSMVGVDVSFEAGSVPVPADPIWHSSDDYDISVARSDDSTVITFESSCFEIRPGSVGFDSPNPAEALDRNYNPLAAMILPYHQMVAFHGFVVDSQHGRIAVVGETGAGKTTLGRALLAQDGTLVSDDLLALDLAANAHPGPPFVRVVDPIEGLELDVGGKFREHVTNQTVALKPVDLFVVIDDTYRTSIELEGADALDALLARPYSPVAAQPAELMLRMQALTKALGSGRVVGIPRRWKPPAELAEITQRLLTNQL